MENKEVRNIGIVLSGGLSRGIAQLAFASEITKVIKDRVSFLSGSSIGAINAYAISCESENDLLKFYSTFEVPSIFSLRKTIKNGLVNKAFRVIGKKEMKVPTYVSACRLLPIDLYYFNLNHAAKNDIKRLINISMSFPILNGPKFFKGRLFMDGGAANNVPIYPTNYYDLDMVIVLHCYPKFYPPENELFRDRILVDVDCTLAMDKNITPFSLDRYSIDTMIEVGRREGHKFAKEVFSDFDFDNVRRRCFNYTISHLEERKKKSAGVLALVEYVNAVFSFKD